jgi:hypothetical protein
MGYSKRETNPTEVAACLFKYCHDYFDGEKYKPEIPTQFNFVRTYFKRLGINT